MEHITQDKPDEAAGHWLFAQECVFVRGVVAMSGLPPTDLPEVAFAGRSNVGKSSLVNALTNRKTLARTSNTPGRTKEINFFALGPVGQTALNLVDLPGYGYARESTSKVEQWTDLVMDYLRGRPNLRRIILLIDSRHGIKNNDREVMKMLDKAAVSYLIVLTKIDKLKQSELDECLVKTREDLRKHVAAHPEIIATSAEKGDGLGELRAHIAELADLSGVGYKTRP